MAAFVVALASLIVGCLAGAVTPQLLLTFLNVIAVTGGILTAIFIPLVIWRVSYWRGRSDEYDERNKRG